MPVRPEGVETWYRYISQKPSGRLLLLRRRPQAFQNQRGRSFGLAVAASVLRCAALDSSSLCNRALVRGRGQSRVGGFNLLRFSEVSC